MPSPTPDPAPPWSIPHEWDEPEDLTALLDLLRESRPTADLAKIRFAFYTAERAHSGQERASGEPYIVHPLAVARVLVDLGMDDDTLCAAFLHDVLEDCAGYTHEGMAKTFGPDVAGLIEGVTKLKFRMQGELTDRQQKAVKTAQTAETLRKMLLAMARDVRVMVIKLADRLHNMQTLDAMPEEKRTRIAAETLDVYAPLAARLGIWQIKWQLEDLAFKHLHPAEFRDISARVAATRAEREADLHAVLVLVKEELQRRGVRIVDLRGRPKHLYSIFNKIVGQGIPFEEVYDLLALRIIVESVSDCYVALGVVHENFVPISALFFDYIAKPKPNGYKSLHTKIVGPKGQPIEIQIRTAEMHAIAEFGVAAHWSYKEGKNAEGKRTDEVTELSNLRQRLLDWSSEAQNSSDYLRAVSTDLFAEQVFVFTPKGDVFDLPIGSTPVDFAFRIHTKLGMTLVGAKVNGNVVPLDRGLQNGDVVEVVTRANAAPSLDWLRFVRSAHTRSKLRAHFRKESKETDAVRGREMIQKELKALGLEPKAYLGDERLGRIAKDFDTVETPTDLLAKVGAGIQSVQSVVAKLRGVGPAGPPPSAVQIKPTREGRLQLTGGGLDGILVNRARCCGPIPGDEIVGYVTRGRGIMLHRRVCPNAQAYAATEPERLMPYDWPAASDSGTGGGGAYNIPLRIVAIDRAGLVADITTIFAETKTFMTAISTRSRANGTAELDIAIEVGGTEGLAYVMGRVGGLTDIISIVRAFGKAAK